MSKYHFFIALVASALLAGCAGAPKMHAHNPDQSEAWNLAWPADIKIRDAKVPKSGPIAPERGIAGAATVGTLSYLSPPPGFSSGFGAGLSALAWLAKDERVSERSRIVAWVPKSEADSPKAAAEYFFNIASEALRSAVHEHSFPEPYVLEEFIERDGSPVKHFNRALIAVFSGGECSGQPQTADGQLVYCTLTFSVSGNPKGRDGLNTIPDMAPSHIGGHPAWRVTAVIGRSYVDKREFQTTWYPRLPEVEIFSKVSEKLPAWSYVYIAPMYSSIQNDEGRFQWLGFPVVLHQGKPFYFIRPEA